MSNGNNEGIGDRCAALRGQLQERGARLVAVSKFHPAEAIMEAYEAGQRDFGENRAVEFVKKAQELPGDIRWHFLGHLQTNKVRMVVPHVSLIHSVDSERLLRLIDAEARRIGRTVDALLQVHVAREQTKTGFTPDELLALAAALPDTPNVRLRGLMAMASNVDDEAVVGADFERVRQLYEQLRQGPMAARPEFDTLSMGMSHDWPLAVAHGSNVVRIGTAIFGQREY